jgi:hypothetical protein
MRYSVYDYTRRQYDYYEAPGPGGTHAGSPPMAKTPSDALGNLVSQSHRIGESPESAAWKLPLGARKIGSGERPQGRIASLGGAELASDPLRLGIYAILAYLGWRAIR